MIPADKWPDWADRHCWDEDGSGWFLGGRHSLGAWQSEIDESGIPLPPGHDWRVPVMRPTVKDSLTVDLGQFREAVGYMIDCAETDAEMSQARRLLALIDSQGTASAVPEAVAWSKTRPVVPGAYWVRGWNLDNGKQLEEALTTVALIDGELCSDLNECNTSRHRDWLPLEQHGDFEWCGPLFTSPAPTAPGIDLLAMIDGRAQTTVAGPAAQEGSDG